MKKICPLLLTLLLLATFTHAQNESPKKGEFSLGVHTEQGVAFIFTKDYTRYEEGYLAGYEHIYRQTEHVFYKFSAGVFSQYRLKKLLALQLGLNYQKVSYNFLAAGSGFGIWMPGETADRYRQSLQYISTPLNIKFYFNQKSKVNVYALAGIQLDMLFSHTLIKVHEGAHHGTPDEVYYQYRKIMTSATAGIGLEFNIKKQFSFFAQYIFQSQLYDYVSNLDDRKDARIILFTGLDIGLMYKFNKKVNNE